MANLFSNNFREEHDYLLLSQPKPSKIQLTDNVYFEYRKSPCSNGCFKWTQPLQWSIKNDKSKWNKLIIENNKNSDILNHVQNSNCNPCFNDIVDNCFCNDLTTEQKTCSTDSCFNKKYKIYPTDEESNIELYSDFFEKNLEIVYIANNQFNTTINLNYIKSFSESFFETKYNNLTNNRFSNLNNDTDFVKIAYVVSKEKLKTKKEIGFFEPNRLGVGKFDDMVESQYYKTESIGNSALTKVRDCKDGFTIPKLNTFPSKAINYKTKGFQPFKYRSNELNSMVADCPEDCKLISDLNGILYAYQEDIFGNNFYLYKNVNVINTIYSKNLTEGSVWVKTLDSTGLRNVNTIDTILSKYKKYYFESGLFSELMNDGILDFKIFYDTLFIKLTNNFIFEKLYFDYAELKSNSDDTFYANGKNTNVHLHKNTKKVTYSYTKDGELYVGIYDLNDPKLCGSATGFGLCEESNDVIMTYNEKLNRLAIISKDNKHVNFYIFKMLGDGYEMIDKVTITNAQDVENKNLIKGELLDNGDYFLIFENNLGGIFPIIINKL